jgi:hypothetical protein
MYDFVMLLKGGGEEAMIPYSLHQGVAEPKMVRGKRCTSPQHIILYFIVNNFQKDNGKRKISLL